MTSEPTTAAGRALRDEYPGVYYWEDLRWEGPLGAAVEAEARATAERDVVMEWSNGAAALAAEKARVAALREAATAYLDVMEEHSEWSGDWVRRSQEAHDALVAILANTAAAEPAP